jgi:hypothetical protein
VFERSIQTDNEIQCYQMLLNALGIQLSEYLLQTNSGAHQVFASILEFHGNLLEKQRVAQINQS